MQPNKNIQYTENLDKDKDANKIILIFKMDAKIMLIFKTKISIQFRPQKLLLLITNKEKTP